MRHLATITVIGRDKTGVIARVTNFLFEHGANIEALEEQVTRGQFSMTLQASWHSPAFRPAAIQSGLAGLGRQLGMEIALRFSRPHQRQRFAIFVTKEPLCLEALVKAWRSRRLSADPVVVVSNRTDLDPAAAASGLPFIHLPWVERARAEGRALQALEKHEIDFVVLARFMKILSPNFVWRHKNKIINIHPSPGCRARIPR